MNDFDYLRTIKWISIVLLAGFIGQFGKSFAKHLMEKIRRKKSYDIAERSIDKEKPQSLWIHSGGTAKQYKKKTKTLAKHKKKETKAIKKQEDK